MNRLSLHLALALLASIGVAASFVGLEHQREATHPATHRPFGIQNGSPWPKFHANAANTGAGSIGGSNGVLRWSYGPVGVLSSSPAVAVDGTIYIGSSNDNLYAVNPDGSLKWSYPTGNQIASSPAIGSDGTIYVGSNDYKVYAVNPDGTLKWRYATGNSVVSSPTVASDGTIYVGSVDNYLYALNSNGTRRWRFGTNNQIVSSPAVGLDGTVYVGSEDGSLYAVSPNGVLDWKFASDAAILGSPAVGTDGTIYFGSSDQYLYAVNPDGSLRWRFLTGSTIQSSPAVDGQGVVYLGSDDGHFYAIDQDGTKKWTYGIASDSSPAIGSDGTVYVGANDHSVYAINPNGALTWRYTTSGLVTSSPAIGADGTVYVGSADGSLYAIGTEANTTPIASLSIAPTTVVAGGSVTGTVTLAQPAPAGGDIVDLMSGDTAAVIPTFVIVPSGASSATFTVHTEAVSSPVAVVVSASSGMTSATASFTIQPGVLAPWPMAHQNAMNTGVGESGGSNGALRWNRLLSGYGVPCTAAIASDGTVYIGSKDARLYALNADGTMKWSYATGGEIWSSPAIGGGGSVYFGSNDGYLYALSATGTLKWRFKTGNAVGSSPVIGSDGTIYVGSSDDSVYAVNPDGSRRWSFATGGPVTSSVAIGSEGLIYVGSQDGSLYALTPAGSQAWSLATGSAIDASPAVGADGTIYVGAGGSIRAVTAYGSSKWAFPVGNTISSTPAIGPDGTIYVGCTDHNLWALSALGGLKFIFQTGGPIDSSATIGLDGTIYIGSNDGNLYAVSATGSKLWSYATGGAISGSPAIGADGAIYVGSLDGSVYAVGTEVSTVPVLGLSLNPTTVASGSTSTATVTLSSPAPAGGDVVTITVGSSAAAAPSIVVVPGGLSTATFAVTARPVTTNTTAILTASSGGTSASASLTVLSTGLLGVSITPSAVIGGLNATGTVTLGAPAPTGGTIVNLVSNSSSVIPGSSVTVPAGASKANFSIQTAAVANVTTGTVTAIQGAASFSATLTVNPPSLASLTMAPSTVIGGANSTGQLSLTGPAPSGGLTVNLSCDSSSATPPTTATVPAGSNYTTFSVQTNPVSASVTATLTASLAASSVTATLTVNPASPASVSVSPSSVIGGVPSAGTVTLNGPAPSGGLSITLSSNSSNAVPPASVTVPSGANSATFTVTTVGVGANTPVIITAKVGTVSVTTTLTVLPAALSSVSLNPSTVASGVTVQATVTLNGMAPPNGTVVNLSSNKAYAQPPPSVTVPGGTTSALFSITTSSVSVSSNATITASYGGTTRSAVLTVSPLELVSLTLNPSSVTGGGTSIGTVSLNGPAGDSGAVITLSSNPGNLAQTPGSVILSPGQTSATFQIATSEVSTLKTATIKATFGSKSISTSLSVDPPTLHSFTLSPTTVTGGSSSTGVVTITGPAPSSGLQIRLLSSRSAAPVQSTITIPGGRTSVSFDIRTGAVSSQTIATVTATLGSITDSATLVIQAPSLVSLTFKPNVVVGLTPTTATVTISSPAPTGGLGINLATNLGIIQFPKPFAIPAGKMSASFAVKTQSVGSTTIVTLIALLNGASVSGKLTINPPVVTSVTLNPPSTLGGKTIAGTVTLGTPAPTAGVVNVKLTSNSTLATVPSSVVVAPGAKTATFTVSTAGAAAGTKIGITAALGPTSKTGYFTLLATALGGVEISPSTVSGGSSTIGTVSVLGPAPAGGMTIGLTCSSSKATVPASVTVPAGQSTVRFTVGTSHVSATTVVSIRASFGNVSRSASLTIQK